MIIELNNTEKDIGLITHFIIQNDKFFPDPLSLHVDICTYCRKLLLLGKVYLYTNNGQPIGLCMGYMNDMVNYLAHIQVLVVDSNSQNRGVGRELIMHFLQAARDAGMREVELTCDLVNDKALHLYNSIGFLEAQRAHPNPSKTFLSISL